MMEKYLVIADADSGIAEIWNAGIVTAETEEEARKKGGKSFGLLPECISAYQVDSLSDGWKIFW